LDELHWNLEVQQARKRFPCQRAWNHIAPDHNVIDGCLPDLFEDSLQRG
jgi:hypothetical protein